MALSPPLDVGDETLCGDVGRLSLSICLSDRLSKDGAARRFIEDWLPWLAWPVYRGRLDELPAPSFKKGLDGSPWRVEGELGSAFKATESLSIS